MYDERLKKARLFRVTYRETDTTRPIHTATISARSSLEAGAEFVRKYPGETMHGITEGFI